MFHSLRLRLLFAMGLVLLIAIGTVAALASRVSIVEMQRYIDRDRQHTETIIEALRVRYSESQGLADPQVSAVELSRSFGERVVVVGDDGTIVADSKGALIGQTLACSMPIEALVVSVGEPGCALPADADRLIVASEAAAPAMFLVSAPVAGMSLSAPAGVAATAPFSKEIGPGKLAVAGAAGVPLANKADFIFQRYETSASAGPLLTFVRYGDTLGPIGTGFRSEVNRSLLLAAGVAGLAAVLLTLFFSRRLLGPIEALTTAARHMERGDLRQRVPDAAGDELGELARAFNAMADGLERAERLRRQMVGDVAHELRTPLTNVRGYLEAVQDGLARPDPAVIESIYEEVLLLNRLVNDLQDLALAEAGRLHLEPRPVAVEDLVERAVALARPAAEQRGVELALQPAPELCVQADPERIGQVLRNLIGNAIAHTPAQGAVQVSVQALAEGAGLAPAVPGRQIAGSGTPGVLERSCEPLAPSEPAAVAHGPSRFVLVEVRDTGGGIPAADLPHIFERFYRADPARARATGGTGLGLAIVRQLVELHGGHVWAESTPGAGTTMRFTLPVAL